MHPTLVMAPHPAPIRPSETIQTLTRLPLLQLQHFISLLPADTVLSFPRLPSLPRNLPLMSKLISLQLTQRDGETSHPIPGPYLLAQTAVTVVARHQQDPG